MKQSLWAIAAAACFSIMAAFVKLASGSHGTLELLFYRSLFGVLAISGFVWSNRSTLTLKTKHIGGHLKRSLLGTLSIVLWFYTLGRMHFGLNMTLTYTTPLFMAASFLLAAFLAHKKAPWLMTASIAVGFVGVCLVLQPSFEADELVPALVCLSVSLIDLFVYRQMKELGRLREPSWRIVFYFTVFGTLTGLIGAFAFEGGLHMPDLRGAAGILGMGLFATLGQICSTRSYAYGNMLLSSCLGFSAIPISAAIGWICFSEGVTPAGLAGMALILAAGLAATVTTKKAEAQEKLEKERTASA
jgi:drug/metabolite transporter (DMT)-like permease